MKFQGKTIWITGASSGIGEAVALEIAKRKAILILSGRNIEALQRVASACELLGSTSVIAPFDLANPKSIENTADQVLASIEHIDCLFHFGGVSQRSFVSETPMEVDRQIMEANFFGTVALTKKVLPLMISQNSGHIAVTSSIVGKFGISYRSAYSASKHALHGYFESVRAENHKHGIAVSVIIPGRVQTNISVNAVNAQGDKYGKMDQGQAKGMPVEKAGQIICRNLEKERKEFLVGGKELLMVHLRRFLPFIYYRLAPKVNPL